MVSWDRTATSNGCHLWISLKFGRFVYGLQALCLFFASDVDVIWKLWVYLIEECFNSKCYSICQTVKKTIFLQVDAPQNAGTFSKSSRIHRFYIRNEYINLKWSLLFNLYCIKVLAGNKKRFCYFFHGCSQDTKLLVPLRMLVSNFSHDIQKNCKIIIKFGKI